MRPEQVVSEVSLTEKDLLLGYTGCGSHGFIGQCLFPLLHVPVLGSSSDGPRCSGDEMVLLLGLRVSSPCTNSLGPSEDAARKGGGDCFNSLLVMEVWIKV